MDRRGHLIGYLFLDPSLASLSLTLLDISYLEPIDNMANNALWMSMLLRPLSRWRRQ